MATKRVKLLDVMGTSSTGSPHGLLVERDDANNTVVLTITGADGKKRHASMALGLGHYHAMIKALEAQF